MQQQLVSHNVLHLWQGTARNEGDRVSQALLGASVTVLETNSGGTWVRVETDDAYRGWVETRLLAAPNTTTPNAVVSAVFSEVRTEARHDAPLIVRLSILSQLSAGPAVGHWAPVTLPSGVTGWVAADDLVPLPIVAPGEIPQAAVFFSRAFLGTPYLWGGSSSFGLDCSGLVQLCYRLAGLTLRRDADIQRSDPRFVSVPFGELRPGDLVFFGKPEKITHVGMQVSDGTFVHAAGGVGVIYTDWATDDRYRPSYVDARRLVPSAATAPVTRHEDPSR